MGYELRRWLAEHLPPGLSSGERLVALEIADQANERTRRAYGGAVIATVIRRTGFADLKQLGKVLGKLGANGIELRVPVRDKQGQAVTDDRGRMLFACNGHAMEFYIPRPGECPALKLPQAGELEAPPSGRPSSAEAPPPGPEAPPSGRASSAEAPPSGGPISSEILKNSSSARARAVRIVTAATGATEEEAESVIKTIEAENKVRSLPGLLRTMAHHGDLAPVLVRVRTARGRSDIGVWLASIGQMPPCEHGTPGGDQARPDTGLPQCPQCRAMARSA